jgi:N-acetylmuramoyl-L-alanine amidase
MPHTGQQLLNIALTKAGQKYQLGAKVPKNNPDWSGPWDCAELATWSVYQLTGKLYGCLNNSAKPEVADAYSGNWMNDVKTGRLIIASQDEANTVPGVILIRKPPLPASMGTGHVAISDGSGGTIEAMDAKNGVKRGKVEGRQWHAFAKIPGLTYDAASSSYNKLALPQLWQLKRQNMEGPEVLEIQKSMLMQRFHPGEIDGVFGPHTLAAVLGFQRANGLIADGVVGPLTLKKLKLLFIKDGAVK